MYSNATYQCLDEMFDSVHLSREVLITIIAPTPISSADAFPLLLVNDGQDFEKLGIFNTVKSLVAQGRIPSLVVVGIHANEDRIWEYGIGGQPDYANRGHRADATSRFVLLELLPYLMETYHIDTQKLGYAGFSLGGLMALDIAFKHDNVFGKVGVFSGALWWRGKALGSGYKESDRLMHAQIRASTQVPNLSCWFQAGTCDEQDDRDQDGVIDSIQDTLECIAELERKGLRWRESICYVEVENGEHNPETWSLVLPDFLVWAFGITSSHDSSQSL
jgi:enterochelin esterase-like enzyme